MILKLIDLKNIKLKEFLINKELIEKYIILLNNKIKIKVKIYRNL